MACIEIPFRTVVGLNISTSPTVDVVIEVDTVPAMWQGAEVLQRGRDGLACSRVQYNTSHTVDLTDGQLSKVPYHKLTISSTSVSIRNYLMKFDPRFSALLRIPVNIDSNKPPPAALNPEKSSKRKKGDQDLTSEEPSVHDLKSNPKRQRFNLTNESLKVCCCTSGCTSTRCSCIKECRKCQGCSCSSCNNPLNILEEFGVNVAEACNDSCLMQNLPKISNLRALMQKSTVATPCCDSLIPLSSCCTGEVECPECDAEYRFSWCSRDLCDEEDRPRNHCAICQTCRDYRDQHCSRCNRCYFAGSYDFPCPCRGGNQRGGFSFMF
ncbi:hypothetical protein ACROYT_G035483 [Oculina patagonica]